MKGLLNFCKRHSITVREVDGIMIFERNGKTYKRKAEHVQLLPHCIKAHLCSEFGIEGE